MAPWNYARGAKPFPGLMMIVVNLTAWNKLQWNLHQNRIYFSMQNVGHFVHVSMWYLIEVGWCIWPLLNWVTIDSGSAVFTKSRQHVCHVRRKIQMSDVGFVKIIIIWCLRLPIGRRRVKSIQEDCSGLSPNRCQATTWTNADVLLIKTYGTYPNEIYLKFTVKMHLKMSFAK